MSRVAKAMTQPLTVIFRFLQNVSRWIRQGRELEAHLVSGLPGDRPEFALVVVHRVFLPLSRVVLQKARIQIWLFEQPNLRIEGKIIVSPKAGGKGKGWAAVADPVPWPFTGEPARAANI